MFWNVLISYNIGKISFNFEQFFVTSGKFILSDKICLKGKIFLSLYPTKKHNSFFAYFKNLSQKHF